jgi:hypothetical protein
MKVILLIERFHAACTQGGHSRWGLPLVFVKGELVRGRSLRDLLRLPARTVSTFSEPAGSGPPDTPQCGHYGAAAPKLHQGLM